MSRSSRRTFAPDIPSNSPVEGLEAPETLQSTSTAAHDAPQAESGATRDPEIEGLGLPEGALENFVDGLPEPDQTPTLTGLQEAYDKVKDFQPDQAPVPYMPIPADQLPSAETQDEIAAQVKAMFEAEGQPEAPPSADEVAAKMSFEAELRGAMGTSIVRLPSGGVSIMLTIPEDETLVIESWADSAGEDFETYAQRMLSMALNAVLMGGAVAG